MTLIDTYKKPSGYFKACTNTYLTLALCVFIKIQAKMLRKIFLMYGNELETAGLINGNHL